MAVGGERPAAPALTTPVDRREARVDRAPSVVLDGVSVTYRVYEDRKPTLRKLVAGGFRARSYRSVEALRDVSLVAYPGEAVGVVGRNGSGKSTMLRALAGLLPVTAGAVYAQSAPMLLGVTAALQPELSGRRNVYLGGTALGMSRREIDRRIGEITAFAGLEDVLDLPLRAYSSGMAARLQFAIATAVVPDVLLVDEALAVGDIEFRRRSGDRIRRMVGNTGTVFLVSHDLTAVTDLCTRAIWIDGGRLVLDGVPQEVVAAYRRSVG